MGKGVLSDKQIRFIFYYLQNGKKNGTDAAKKAGYSEKTAKQKAHSLLSSQDVLVCIRAHEQLKALDKKVNSDDDKIKNVDAVFVLKERIKILEDCTKKVALTEWDYNTHKAKVVGEKMLDPRSASLVLRDIYDSLESDNKNWSDEDKERLFKILEQD